MERRGGGDSRAMIHPLTAALVLMAAAPIGAVGAQPIGPPISPQQQFEAQPAPRTNSDDVFIAIPVISVGASVGGKVLPLDGSGSIPAPKLGANTIMKIKKAWEIP